MGDPFTSFADIEGAEVGSRQLHGWVGGPVGWETRQAHTFPPPSLLKYTLHCSVLFPLILSPLTSLPAPVWPTYAFLTACTPPPPPLDRQIPPLTGSPCFNFLHCRTHTHTYIHRFTIYRSPFLFFFKGWRLHIIIFIDLVDSEEGVLTCKCNERLVTATMA